MSFLGLPCPCGWALDEVSDSLRSCSACGRRYELRSFGWVQTTLMSEIKTIMWCKHKREVGEHCPHCPEKTARER